MKDRRSCVPNVIHNLCEFWMCICMYHLSVLPMLSRFDFGFVRMDRQIHSLWMFLHSRIWQRSVVVCILCICCSNRFSYWNYKIRRNNEMTSNKKKNKEKTQSRQGEMGKWYYVATLWTTENTVVLTFQPIQPHTVTKIFLISAVRALKKEDIHLDFENTKAPFSNEMQSRCSL